MKSAVVVFPGINRERDMMLALEAVTGIAPVAVWHTDPELPKVDLVVVPGGFSYGDYLRCGAIAARSPIMADIRAKAEKGLKVLGVCNGFQIVAEAGLLPGALVRNAHLHFVCREVKLAVENNSTFFTNRMKKAPSSPVPWLMAKATISAMKKP
jgi:phosphoribosylformylglycinamidine synthase